jgi:hypothetical protein
VPEWLTGSLAQLPHPDESRALDRSDRWRRGRGGRANGASLGLGRVHSGVMDGFFKVGMGEARSSQGYCILGMHRSGTSCLAGCLEEAGLHVGEVEKWAPHNTKGNREHLGVRALNDEVLAESQGAWDCPPRSIFWTKEQAQRRDEIVDELAGRGDWAFKDPRSLLTRRFWQAGIPSLRFLGTFRHPLDVARSLSQREGMSLGDSLSLWVAYNEKLLAQWVLHRFPVVSFDWAPAEYKRAVSQLTAAVGKPVAAENIRFFDPEIRHHGGIGPRPPPDEVAVLYGRLLEISGSPLKVAWSK